MKVKELIAALSKYPENDTVLIKDECGCHRDIIELERKNNPSKHSKDNHQFVTLSIDYEWFTLVGDLI